MLLACCWLDFGKAAQQACALRAPSGGADGSPKAQDPRRHSVGSLAGHAFTTSLHPALFEQVSLLASFQGGGSGFRIQGLGFRT